METCWNADYSSRPTAATVVKQILQINRHMLVTPAPNWNDTLFAHQIWNHVQHPPLLSLSEFHPDNNLLARLVETEKIYLNLLEGLVKKVAAAWSRKDMPPVVLDTMFRGVENVYRFHRECCPVLQEASATGMASEAFQELAARWPGEPRKGFGASYLSFIQIYCSGLDDWEPVKSNRRLSEILNRVSVTKITGTSWTLDGLFLLPVGRLKYYKNLYSSLLENISHSASHPTYHAFLGFIKKVDTLLEIYEERKDLKASSSSVQALISSTYAVDNGDESDALDMHIHSSHAELTGPAHHGVNKHPGSESQYVSAFSSPVERMTWDSDRSERVLTLNNYQPSRSSSPVSALDADPDPRRLSSPPVRESHRLSNGSPFQYSRSPSPELSELEED